MLVLLFFQRHCWLLSYLSVQNVYYLFLIFLLFQKKLSYLVLCGNVVIHVYTLLVQIMFHLCFICSFVDHTHTLFLYLQYSPLTVILSDCFMWIISMSANPNQLIPQTLNLYDNHISTFMSDVCLERWLYSNKIIFFWSKLLFFPWKV